MKALIYSYGTRGDIQPYLALAYAMQRAGHEAVLAAPRLFAALAAEYGVAFAPLDDAAVTVRSRADIRHLQAHSDRPTEQIEEQRRAVRQEMVPHYATVLDDLWAVAREHGPDLIVHSHAFREAIPQIAEKLGVPHVLGALYPNFVVSHDYPAFGLLSDIFSGRQDQSRIDVRTFLPPQVIDVVDRWRAETLGLPPREGRLDFRFGADGTPTPVVHGFSPHVIPEGSDWPDTVHTDGFWHLPEPLGWEPPARLVRFLEAGEKPVFIGFGSAVGTDPERTTSLVLDAVRESGFRAVVVAGWGGLSADEARGDVLAIEDVPYGWLMPQVRLAVNSGSPGAHNAALSAGIPQVTCPYEVNQLMWGEHLHRLGVAPPPLHQRELTASGLAAAIVIAATDPALRKAAARLGGLLSAEDGAASAVKFLETIR
ncbi:glycosyltransferase [Streptomyces sp. WI04-05B]|uniref:glycosyltransferase n=1 Tax=Streptomyces TaxID=1883 RepID=UPI0029BCD9C3|nr:MULTISPECIES: glycosyltransferase [unclassified Streptomyces]MDX2547089.1 glycosyltransferase [Streptomyces sp. WI04-05B]MDX2589778.1 glycosyltransferase [Streptomyces sp. WI04-05A]MDX3753227.1 glycosyltransferase [Streptomyces sp. AK08-02]